MAYESMDKFIDALGVTPEERDQIDKRIWICLQLNGVEQNLLKEVTNFCKKKGLYRLQLKHDGNMAAHYLKKCYKTFFGDETKMTREQAIAFGDDGEDMENAIKEAYGLKDLL